MTTLTTITTGLLLASAPTQADTWVNEDTGNIRIDHGVDEDGDTWPDEVDCNDWDASMYPGAEDTPYDGIDSDCQWDDDYDQDKDGYVPTEYAGLCTYPNPNDIHGKLPYGDCNDRNPNVNPAAEDKFGNGVDENCDGADGRACSGGSSGFVLFLMPMWALRRRRT